MSVIAGLRSRHGGQRQRAVHKIAGQLVEIFRWFIRHGATPAQGGHDQRNPDSWSDHSDTPSYAVQFGRAMVSKPLWVGIALLCLTGWLRAHPMGNFSVSHYSRLEATGQS